MPRGRMRASDGIADPHCVQKAAGGVDRWQVGHRISPGFGVAISAALCLHRPGLARGRGSLRSALDATDQRGGHELLRQDAAGPGAGATPRAAARRAGRALLGAGLDPGPRRPLPGASGSCRNVVERWVMDGGYSPIRDLIWSRADTIVWLDYPMPTVLGRWARRTASRIRSREEFWPGTGNRESLRHSFGRDSLLVWILTTHRRRRTTMAAQLAARSRAGARATSLAGRDRSMAARYSAGPPVRRELIRRRDASTRFHRQIARASRSADGP